MAVTVQAMAAGNHTRVQAREQARERVAHLPALTGLRFVAALGVVVCHFGLPVLPAGPLRALAAGGVAGVTCFFVLSGFILAYTYLPAGRNGLRGTARSFYLARMARIYPVYLLSLVCALGPALWSPPLAHRRLLDPLTALVGLDTVTLTQAWLPFARSVWNPPGWSLSAEACFYVLLPLLARPLALLGRRGLLALAACCWALSLLVAALDLSRGQAPGAAAYWFEVAYANPLLRLPDFVLGLALGRLFVQAPSRPHWAPLAALAAGAGVLGLLAFGAGLPDIVRDGGALSPLFGLLVYGLAGQRGVLVRILSSAPLVLLGEASYSLYLLHYPLHDWLVRLLGTPASGGPACVFFLLYLALALVCALLALHLVEQPARRAIRQHWGGPRSSPPRDGSTGALPPTGGRR